MAVVISLFLSAHDGSGILSTKALGAVTFAMVREGATVDKAR